ncbi:crotonase/enoyl-CoA hydratase family protein [Massilia sp. YIM B04103]|uniref:crotonase/enoyl-CoA hydratase family protein n=1 Tax=Massilia sp. YIM B04103 TaxID=2963106 RepID=UPI00210D3F82|nr:crotonase/enoyl-CoA hydratase family protein [Massilia sp. YIM B04103]
MTKQHRVTTTIADGLAYVRLARPEQHNAIDFDMLHAVVKAARSLRKQPGVRAVIVHGEGPSFCSGLDFKSVLARPMRGLLHYAQLWYCWRNNFQDWSMGWRDVPAPVIAAIHGNCFGGGIQLALGADIRIATPDARLSLMEAKWGLIPDMGGVALLRELVPIDVAKELVLSGRVFSGAEAKELQLVTHLADDPLAAAEALAAELSARSPDALAAGKFLLQRAWSKSESGALAQERRWQRRLMGFANNRIAIQNNKGGKTGAGKAYQARRIQG